MLLIINSETYGAVTRRSESLGMSHGGDMDSEFRVTADELAGCIMNTRNTLSLQTGRQA